MIATGTLAGRGCSNLVWGYIIVSIMIFITIGAMLGISLYSCKVIYSMKKRKKSLKNAVGTTIVFSLIAQIFIPQWFMYYGLTGYIGSYAIEKWCFAVGLSIGVGVGIVAFLNLSLMWLQVAESSKTLKKAGSNLVGKYRTFVMIFAPFQFILLVVLIAILSMFATGMCKFYQEPHQSSFL